MALDSLPSASLFVFVLFVKIVFFSLCVLYSYDVYMRKNPLGQRAILLYIYIYMKCVPSFSTNCNEGALTFSSKAPKNQCTKTNNFFIDNVAIIIVFCFSLQTVDCNLMLLTIYTTVYILNQIYYIWTESKMLRKLFVQWFNLFERFIASSLLFVEKKKKKKITLK